MTNPQTIMERYPPPPLDEVLARIRSFETDKMEARIATIRSFVNTHAVLSYRWGAGWRYRRARRLGDQPRPDHVDGLLWRKDVPAPIGRANPAGFPMLYLADRRDTALSEVRAADEKVLVSEFGIRPGRSISVAPIGELSMIQRTGRGVLTSGAAEIINGMLKASSVNATRTMLIVDAFLLDCLSNREDDYERASAVTMAILNKLPAVTAIAYPSRRQLGAVNFAVRADSLWDAWGVTAVQEARATHLAMGYYRLRQATHVTRIDDAGTLSWSPNPPEDMEAVVVLDPPWHPSGAKDAHSCV